MKLFIWTDFGIGQVGYYGGTAFAIADDKKDAKALIEKQVGYKIRKWGKMEIKPLDQKTGVFCFGGD